ncbi:hypothetical protein BBJ28_00010572 [Nothophytophthora sp. Chile5]|nr:hypothetical protein BBJ28_00010572 [Nothophytophthora sp. Chile5]
MRSLIHQGSSPPPAPAPVDSSYASAPSFAPMPPFFQRAGPSPGRSSSSAGPPTLAPLRFIIPSRSGFDAPPPFQAREPELEPEPQSQSSLLFPDEPYPLSSPSMASSPLLQPSEAIKPKKPTVKRARTPKSAARSTKSKARPGLRKGKWTEEESRYAAQLTNYFKEGLLPLERGTMLRLYLSQKLNCEPMRITKKFTGGECIGKQVFRPCSPTPEARVRLMQAQLELVALEAAFVKRVREYGEDAPARADEADASSPVARSQPVLLKPRGSSSSLDDDKATTTNSGDVEDDASAVGLLLDFFYKANRHEKPSGDVVKEESKETTPPSSSAEERTVSPRADGEADAAINSPTKRMRALSVSSFVADPAGAKRSRVGSFTVCA